MMVRMKSKKELLAQNTTEGGNFVCLIRFSTKLAEKTAASLYRARQSAF